MVSLFEIFHIFLLNLCLTGLNSSKSLNVPNWDVCTVMIDTFKLSLAIRHPYRNI